MDETRPHILVVDDEPDITANLAALGMLLYCAVFSIGVMGQAGNIPPAIFFGVIAALAAAFSGTFIIESTKGGNQ